MPTMKHRKLFPSQNATSQTDCEEFCDPSCTYNCYPFPEFLYPPPVSPPPPLSAIDPSDQTITIPPYVIVLVTILASIFLLVGYYLIVIKSCTGLFSRGNNERPPTSNSDDTEEDFVDQVDHPIWYITTIGLQQSIINSITVCKYKKGEGLIEGTDCSVCLNEFRENETLRLLPKCNHAFHIPCIDTWLRSHINCPLCRSHIVIDAINSNVVYPPLAPLDQNRESFGRNQETQMENSENDSHLVRVEPDQDQGEITQVDDELISKEVIYPNENCDLDVIGDQNERVKMVKRSVSFDSLSAVTIICDQESSVHVEDEENLITQLQKIGRSNLGNDQHLVRIKKYSSSITQCLHISPVAMKRSFSCGGRFFNLRNNRRLNLVIPI